MAIIGSGSTPFSCLTKTSDEIWYPRVPPDADSEKEYMVIFPDRSPLYLFTKMKDNSSICPSHAIDHIPPSRWMNLANLPCAEAESSSSAVSRFDFPDPLGPMITFSAPGSQVTSRRDLNPVMCRLSMRMALPLPRPAREDGFFVAISGQARKEKPSPRHARPRRPRSPRQRARARPSPLPFSSAKRTPCAFRHGKRISPALHRQPFRQT